LYRERFPHRRHPSSDVFLGLVNRTRTIGFLVPDRNRVGGVDHKVRTLDTEGVVLQLFTEDGTRSVRNVTDILNQSKNTIKNILKGNHMHPNHYTKVQRLLSEDYPPRVELQEHEEIQAFLQMCYLRMNPTFATKGLLIVTYRREKIHNLNIYFKNVLFV
jgi:hypothetical protein